ncbi:MAG: class I SAM-dependent methyltransferase [Congregibacter sp.]|nr:class I SAM-dependent methyltransferase [Congregibacter sp.]
MTTENSAQIEFWNGETGQNWVTQDALMEDMLQPLGEAVMSVLAPIAGERALDIGCGCGHTSVALATRVGPEGAVTGVDVSAPMLKVAKTLADTAGDDAAPTLFLEADAQTHTFHAPHYDVVFSRFGVMFFEDPVAAFTNIRSAMSPAGRLAFCCWQPRAVNPFMTVPAMAALELLPAPPQPPPRTPGPFAFEEADYVDAILQEAGYRDICISPLSQLLEFGRGLALTEIVERLVQIGPIAQMIRDAPADLQQPVRDRVSAAIAPFYDSRTGLALEGQFWTVSAKR